MVDSLDLALLDTGASHAIAFARWGSDLAVGRIDCDGRLEELAAFRTRLERALRGKEARPNREELRSFGRRLFDFFMVDAVRPLYERLPKAHVRLQILSDRAEIQVLPWEFMLAPRDVPGPNKLRSVVRIVPSIGAELDAKRRGQKIRVLLVSAEPMNEEPVSWSEVQETIEAVFQARMPKGYELKVICGATRTQLLTELQDQRFNYDIFHFSGHGDVRDGEGRILLVHPETQKGMAMRSDELALILRDRGVRLAILSACDTAAGDFASDFSVTASTLVRAGIPAVIANQMPIPDQTVAPFVGAVYAELLRSGDIDLAVAAGRLRLAIELADTQTALEWGIPTLYRHVGGAQMFSP